MKNFSILIALVLCLNSIVFSQAYKNNPVDLSQKIGPEIDRSEREKYKLFPGINGFHSAIIYKESDTRYVVAYKTESATGWTDKIIKISAEVFETTCKHVQLVEEYNRIKKDEVSRSCEDVTVIYGLGLKYAASSEYKLTSQLFNTLISEYPACPQTEKVKQMLPDIRRLWKAKKGLFIKGGMLDHSGRPEILIFSGYYGLWLGVATPIAFKSESPQVYALGLLAGGPAAFYITYSATQNANISDGRATMIMLGGHWGTWQGLGWGYVSDMGENTVVGLGEVTGIGGIIAASLLTRNYDFSESHASITNSALPWGTWFGMIAGIVADHDGDMLIQDMLIGSNIGILAAGIGAKNSTMPVSRIRMINLAGVLGATFGFGVDMLVEVHGAKTAFGIVGASSAAGLWLGYRLTRDKGNGNNGKGSGSVALMQQKRWQLTSDIKLHHQAFTRNTHIPFLQLKVDF